jgi:hypothetical protein
LDAVAENNNTVNEKTERLIADTIFFIDMTHLFFPSSRGLFEQFPKYHYTSLFEQQARPNVNVSVALPTCGHTAFSFFGSAR